LQEFQEKAEATPNPDLMEIDTKSGSAGTAPFTFTELPRGGTLVEGQTFRAQIGCYPETIKDTMKSEKGVPDLFLLPDDLFDTNLGVSISDAEFPVYFNFYIKSKQCRFICQKHQVRSIVRVLREAIFGPFKLYLEREYPEGREAAGFPDMKREMAFYKIDERWAGGLRLKNMIQLYTFDQDGRVEVDGVTISSVSHNRYRFEANGQMQECKFRAAPPPAPVLPRDVDSESGVFFAPPVFGVTTIGSGHGFDTESKTSGFIIWIDGKGIMVDPPVSSTVWLQENRVNPRLLEDLILTHCHADHDAGTLQKVLEEGRIRIHATETVMDSFVAKYSSLSGLKSSEFRTLFEYQPIRIGVRTTIAGAKFLFKYNLHPIPTVGFDVKFEGESFYYSCDTLYDPAIIQDLHEQGILSKGRMEDLLDVPWGSSLIFHEAGIPPIHTPMSVLADLPEEVRNRIYLVHVSESAIPPESGLRIAVPGTANTLEIPVPTPEKSLAYKILDVVTHTDLFSEMKFSKALECLAITHHCVVEAGEVFIKRGTFGDRFFMILSGEVEVLHESLPQRLVFGRYDYIGETAIILNQPRNADIVARTRTELLYIEKEDFLRFVRDSSLPTIFRRLNVNRSSGARWTFEKHKVLAALSPLQKNQLLCSMVSTKIEEGTYLYRSGETVAWYYLVDSGEVRVSGDDGEAVVGPGAFIGEFGPCYESILHGSEAQALSELSLYKISASDMRAYFSLNPGTFVRTAKSLSDTLRRGRSPRSVV
jgi:CRP-like cAMP-binding protein